MTTHFCTTMLLEAVLRWCSANEVKALSPECLHGANCCQGELAYSPSRWCCCTLLAGAVASGLWCKHAAAQGAHLTALAAPACSSSPAPLWSGRGLR